MPGLYLRTNPFKSLLRFAKSDTELPDLSDEDLANTTIDKAYFGPSLKERVRAAFSEIPLNDRERDALRALLNFPGSTATELSQKCGWLDTGWRTQMLLLCQRRRRCLWPGGMASDITNGIIITALTDYDSHTLKFRPRPELAGVLRSALQAA